MSNRLKAIWFLTLIPPSLFFYGLGSGKLEFIASGLFPVIIAAGVCLLAALIGEFDR